MRLGRGVSEEISERYAADKELTATLRDKLTVAEDAQRALRAAREGPATDDEVHALAVDYEVALKDALITAEAAERVAMGPKTYPHGDAETRRMAQIATRKARARASVRPWTAEVDRLRTLREQHKLSFRAERVAGV